MRKHNTAFDEEKVAALHNEIGDANIYMRGLLQTTDRCQRTSSVKFSFFDLFVSVDNGSVVFGGAGIDPVTSKVVGGLYTTLEGSLTEVIDFTDSLDGKTLSALFTGPESLSGNSIAFYAGFTDGSQGIFRADPVPVPFEFSPGLGILMVGAWGVTVQLNSIVQKWKSSGSGFSNK